MFKTPNLSKGTLSSQLLIAGTTAILQTGQGVKFGSTGASNIFVGILWGASYASPELDTTAEFITAYRQTGAGNEDKFTLDRGKENTSAKQWEIGDNFMAVVSNALLEELRLAIANKVDVVAGKGLSTEDYATADKNKLSGIETSADVTDAGNVGPAINGSTPKTTMVDADKIAIIDTEASNVLKTLSWAYVKSILKTYFDGIYATGTIPVKASKSEASAGTDDAKFLTSLSAAELWKLPEGSLWNGKIVPSVASNNLTVALKGKDGNDPSATNPVYARIGGELRTITSALSVTKNAGANTFYAGSTEIATKEIDYFVYLGYNATDGVVLGFSRIPSANSYDDFSTTSTNEKYCAISTITHAAATDYYNVIGRFAATLSAGAGYTWTVPTFTAKNLIQRPIWETRPMSFVITPSAYIMTVNTLSTALAIYSIKGNRCIVDFYFTVTTAGSAGTEIYFKWPFPPLYDSQQYTGCAVLDTASYAGIIRSDSTNFTVKRYDSAAFGIGAGRGCQGIFNYQI